MISTFMKYCKNLGFFDVFVKSLISDKSPKFIEKSSQNPTQILPKSIPKRQKIYSKPPKIDNSMQDDSRCVQKSKNGEKMTPKSLQDPRADRPRRDTRRPLERSEAPSPKARDDLMSLDLTRWRVWRPPRIVYASRIPPRPTRG